MERITDKLRKLLALAERGCGGEAENAKRLLEAQLRRYGMTLEDLLNEGKKKRAFKYRNNEEMKIIIHVLLAVLGSKAEAFCDATYCSSAKRVDIELTDLQYAEISDMVDFYKRQFNKEKKRLMSEMFSAFINKHNLYDCDPIDEMKQRAEEQKFDRERLWRILTLSAGMEDIHYRKSISNQ